MERPLHPHPPRRPPRIFTLIASLAIVLVAPCANADIGDWIARLHGVAPQTPKAPPPAGLARVSTAPGLAPDPQVESFLRTLAAAVLARNGSLLVPRLATSYAVEGLPPGAKAPDVMVQALERMRGPEQIVVESVQAAAGLRTVKARFLFAAPDESLKTLILDAAGNLVASDLFRLAHG